MVTKQYIRVEDVVHLRGQYIVLLNDDNHDIEFSKRVEFYAEKRVSLLVCVEEKYMFVGMFYNHSKPMTAEEVVQRYNKQGDRYHRLMTPEEIRILNDYMVEQRKYL